MDPDRWRWRGGRRRLALYPRRQAGGGGGGGGVRSALCAGKTPGGCARRPVGGGGGVAAVAGRSIEVRVAGGPHSGHKLGGYPAVPRGFRKFDLLRQGLIELIGRDKVVQMYSQ
ncbi:hypothetical protein SORBI_3010G098866 [Sorghum bicolor]|uniref:Uncharacterized protein n=1 Tax=Sorghum bicolor TaxID=4558 RepID=A0A1W0VS79_SORBI|nr:hypothetical protein SORBI_3010G098866 [Sorghum bicolor]